MDDNNSSKTPNFDYLFTPKPPTLPAPSSPPDSIQNPTPVESDELEDKKYQAVLDKYASDLSSNTVVEEPAPEITITPPPSEVVLPPPILPPTPNPIAPPPIVPTNTSPMVSSSVTPPSQPTIFKYLFFLSLFVFIFVVCGLVWTMVKINKLNNYLNIPTAIPTTIINNPTPTETNTIGCDLNDQHYAVGATFPAADNCNSCTCNDTLTIDCTQKECSPVATPTAS